MSSDTQPEDKLYRTLLSLLYCVERVAFWPSVAHLLLGLQCEVLPRSRSLIRDCPLLFSLT
jgi:hypothetical protein